MSFHRRQSERTDASSRTTETESSHGSTISGSDDPKKPIDIRKRGLYSSRMEFIILAMSANLSIIDYTSYAYQNISNGGTILQLFTVYMLVGIPASYMQMILGQYAHMGAFLLKRMVPIADGAGFSYCITIFLVSLFSVLDAQTIVLYAMLSLVPGPLQWSRCGSLVCWEVSKECVEEVPCVNETVKLAAFVYWNASYHVYDEKEPSSEDESPTYGRDIVMPSMEDFWVSLFTWVLIYLLTLISIVRVKKAVRYFSVVHLIFKSIAMVAVVLVTGPTKTFTAMTLMSISNLKNLYAWKESVIRVIVSMTLGDFSHVMMGSYSADSTKVGTISFLSGMLSFCSVVMDDVLINSASIALTERVNVKLVNRYILFRPTLAPLHLTLMPTIYELCLWPRLWNLLYFSNKAMAILFRAILNIVFLYEAVSHRFPTLLAYRKYISPIFCFGAFIVGSLFRPKDIFETRINFYRVVTDFCQCFNVLFFGAMVSYVYGVRRFCDDIHFLRRVPPNLFWKIVWITFPIILILTLDYSYLDRSHKLYRERIFEIILVFSPYLALTTIAVVKKIIERKTITLITPELRWGPKDLEKRIRRRLFNPRTATRYEFAKLQCKHVCLLENKLLKQLVAKEVQMMSRFGGPQAGAMSRLANSMDDYMDMD